jgi:acetylornithine/succinyldiaminopimelate/putrescine aminotransferase
MLGVALEEGIDAREVYADLLDHGLIVNAVNPSTIRLVPPITVTDDEIDEAVELIAAALRRAGATP